MKTLLILAFLLLPGIAQAQEYLLTLEIYTSTFTLNLWTHLKNHMNAIEITIPTTEQFYNQIQVGQKLTDNFKLGSLAVNGSISELIIEVKKKEIR